MIKILLLFAMIFMHIVDDYYLQGWLASAKQKSYWEQNAPDKLYEHDYIMALFMHSFSWAFMIMIIPTIYVMINAVNIGAAGAIVIIFFLFNLSMHMITDDKKANKKEISLVKDQLMHLIQIAWTWFFLIAIL